MGGAVKIGCVRKIDTPHGVDLGLPPADTLIWLFRMALLLPNYSEPVSNRFAGQKISEGGEKEETRLGRKQRRKKQE